MLEVGSKGLGIDDSSVAAEMIKDGKGVMEERKVKESAGEGDVCI